MSVRKPYWRRVCTTLLAAALVFAAFWLSNGPVDSRFVGKWTVDMGGVTTSWPAPCIEFLADGAGTRWSSNIPQNRNYSPVPLRWSTDGKRLIWRYEYNSLPEAIFREYDRIRYRFWNRNAVAPHESVLEVVDVAEDEIQVDVTAPDQSKLRWILRRAE
jgi:hypothetical protein